MRLFLLIFLSLFFVSGAETVLAEDGLGTAKSSVQTTERRGLITSARCPLSCRDLNVPESECRAWKQGTKCMVEDFTQPAGHRSMFKVKPGEFSGARSAAPRSSASKTAGEISSAEITGRRGLITSSSCPYTCKMAKVPADLCREWQQGSKCMVEDLGQPAGHRSLIRY